jgi:hypothetical protein
VKLFFIIKSASNPPSNADKALLRKYIANKPENVDKSDQLDRTPCHYAISKLELLEILALEGKAQLPENMTTDAALNERIEQLRREQKRRKKYYGFHLHDMIRKSQPMQNIDLRLRKHLREINETSYPGRNACHWAAVMNRLDYLMLFAELGGNLDARDLDNKTPFDLATTDETKNKIKELVATYQNTANRQSSQTLSDQHHEDLPQEPDNIFTRLQSSIEGIPLRIMKTLSPRRERMNNGDSTKADGPVSPRRNPTACDLHPKAKSPPLPTRENGKLKRPALSMRPSILKHHQSNGDSKKNAGATRQPFMPEESTPNSSILTRNLIPGSHTHYLPMPSLGGVVTSTDPTSANALMPVEHIANGHVPIRSNTPYVLMPADSISTGNRHPQTNTPKNTISKKTVRFTNGYSPHKLTETPSDESHRDATQEQAVIAVQPNFSKPEEQVTFLKSTETLISIFKNDDLIDFRNFLLYNKISPNHKLSGFGRPYLIQAFLSKAGQIFIFLLQQGAALDVRTNSGKSIIDYISESQTQERIDFLKLVREGILTTISASRIKSNQEVLGKIESSFVEKLQKKELCNPFKRKSKTLEINILNELYEKHPQSKQLAQILFDLCIGNDISKNDNEVDLKGKTTVDINDKNTVAPEEMGVFNPEIIRNCVMGLLAHNDPNVMVSILTDLYPHLQQEQKLIAFFIIKEMVMRDRFSFCHRNPQFCESILPAFIKASMPDKLNELHVHLRDMIRLQNKIEHPFGRAVHQIDIIISKFGVKNKNVSTWNYQFLADELRIISSEYLCTFKYTELVNLAWCKNNKLDAAPTIVDLTSLFNKISDYFVKGILQQSSVKKRMAYITLCIKTLDELINGDPCDLQSAMAISAALARKFVAPYLVEFQKHDNKVYQLWENAQTQLSEKRNYNTLRNIMDDLNKIIYPYIGLVTKDLTPCADMREMKNKALIEGQLFLDLLKFQDSVRAIPSSAPQSNLSHLLHMQKDMEDVDFELIVMKLNPTPIRLDETMTLPNLIRFIDLYVSEKLALKVSYESNHKRQVYFGLSAIESMFSWIKEEIKASNIDRNDIAQLARKLELIPNTNKDRIEFYRKQLLSWVGRQTTIKPSVMMFKSLPVDSKAKDNNQEMMKKGKEHADDDYRGNNRL